MKTARLKIKVTEEHIKNGQRCLASCCPVALAIKDVIETDRVAVGENGEVFVGENDCGRPQGVKEFVTRFDAERSVQPFEFILEI